VDADQRSILFAVDFDGTIVEHKFPAIGKIIGNSVDILIRLQKKGHKIILWTCRTGMLLQEAVEFLADNGFNPDAINNNYTSMADMAYPKVFAEWYIDDRNFPYHSPEVIWRAVERTFLKED
jgi:hydroxymethylpyrimidine pyrophosphatase-like HAD family hydrolase